MLNCATNEEALKVESWFINRWKPPLNEEKPFWYRKYIEKNAETKKRRSRKRPTYRNKDKENRNKTIIFTEYLEKETGKIWRDPTQLFRERER